jgi:hypothetical protein
MQLRVELRARIWEPEVGNWLTFHFNHWLSDLMVSKLTWFLGLNIFIFLRDRRQRTGYVEVTKTIRKQGVMTEIKNL